MALRVVWSPSALREIERIFDYLLDFNPKAAAKVAESLIEAGDNLAILPYRGRLVPKTDLRELVASYPYILRYQIAREEVYILRVRHTSRQVTDLEF